MPEKDGHLQSKKSPGMLLLPSRQNDRPIEASELREILSWTLNEPTWETELVSGLTVQRLSARDDSRDCYVERGRCEVVLDAPIETVFALVDDPEERAKWDDLVGPSMMKYKASGCRFVSFKFDGLMGLAAEQFFFWDAQQAYDRNCLECGPGRPFWSYVLLWQPAAVSWEGLPSYAGCHQSAAFAIGLVRDGAEPETKTKVVGMARVEVSSGMVQYFLPSVIRTVLSSQSQRLLETIGQINADAQHRKLLQEKGCRGLQLAQQPDQEVPETTNVKKDSKDDAFLLEMPETLHTGHAAASKHASTAASLETVRPAREAQGRTDVQDMQAEGDGANKPDEPVQQKQGLVQQRVLASEETGVALAREAEDARNSRNDVVGKANMDFMFSAGSDAATQTSSPERRRRKLELPSGFETELAELDVGFGLQRLESGSMGARPSGSSRSSYQDPEPKSPLRLRLANMQSKWLQDAQPKFTDVKDLKAKLNIAVAHESELKRLRGTNSWLIHLMREAGAEEFLAPPWQQSPSYQPTEQAEELPH
ncbi:unnamed protein product [Durusdinium trenchii]|uniref:START domain-containing protein n=1 Tax=Durusdinium trenchii TaxID=1381693 RepID=A0ABP0J7D0_9DINO